MRRSGRNRQSKKPVVCVYCGESRLPTKDHVIPQCFFPDSKAPAEVIVVPICRPCNNRKSRDDGYLRDVLVSDIDSDHNPICHFILANKVRRSAERNSSDLIRAAIQGGRLEILYGPDGDYVDQRLAVPLDWHRVERYMRWVVRGLHWSIYNDRVPDIYKFKVSRISKNLVADVCIMLDNYDAPSHIDIGEHIFSFRHILLSPDDPYRVFWLLGFYEGVAFAALTSPPGYAVCNDTTAP